MGPDVVSYKEQAVFALCSWPFSLKLLWAPIVDSVYLQCETVVPFTHIRVR